MLTPVIGTIRHAPARLSQESAAALTAAARPALSMSWPRSRSRLARVIECWLRVLAAS